MRITGDAEPSRADMADGGGSVSARLSIAESRRPPTDPTDCIPISVTVIFTRRMADSSSKRLA